MFNSNEIGLHWKGSLENLSSVSRAKCAILDSNGSLKDINGKERCKMIIEETVADNTLGKLAVFLLIIPMVRISEVFLTFDFFWKNLIFYCFLSFFVLFYIYKFNVNVNYKLNFKKSWLIILALIIGLLFGICGNYLFNFEKIL